MTFLPLMLFVYMALQWSSAFLSIEVISHEMDPLAAVASRIFIAALVMTVFVSFRREKVFPLKRASFHALSLGLFSMAIPWTLFFMGEKLLPSTVTAIMMATAPIFTIFLTRIISRVPLTPLKKWGIFVGFFGVILLMIPKAIQQGFHGEVIGILFCLGGAASYAIYATWSKEILNEISVSSAHFFQSIGALIIFLPVLVLAGTEFPDHLSGVAIGNLISLGVGASVLAQLAFLYFVKKYGATEAISVDYAIPMFAMVQEYFFFHQLITPLSILGGVIILGGLAMTQQTSWIKKAFISLKKLWLGEALNRCLCLEGAGRLK